MERPPSTFRDRRTLLVTTLLWYSPELRALSHAYEIVETAGAARQPRQVLQRPRQKATWRQIAWDVMVIGANWLLAVVLVGMWRPAWVRIYLLPSLLFCGVVYHCLTAKRRFDNNRAQFRVRVRERLIARGIPLCRHCGYDLAGTPASERPRCPECGELASEKALPLLSEAAS